MTIQFPFLTSYDPPGTSEGTLDPLGLYQIADQLAVQLVPAVRERMQRIRFCTAMAVGALVVEGLEDAPAQRDGAPYLVWEWLVVEALVRTQGKDESVWGVPGTQVARRAIDQHGYLDARSYLKTPRIFGFHGVYKRLAHRLGVVDVHLAPGPNAEGLVDAWAGGLGAGGFEGSKPLLGRWREAIRRSLAERPPRAKPNWSADGWAELAAAFAPGGARVREKRYLQNLLLPTDQRQLGALPAIWKLQPEFTDEEYCEETLHDRLREQEPVYAPLLDAIAAYEAFARSLQDAFDVLKAVAATLDARGFAVPEIASDAAFAQSVVGVHERFEAAYRALAGAGLDGLSLQSLFNKRFGEFAEPLNPGMSALVLCTLHETVQRDKSADGKRPWFDRLGAERIYIRHQYREARREILPGRYVHDYRGWPIRRFSKDLT